MTRVAVIGPGRAGTSVALAADEAGYDVEAVSGRSDANVERFLQLIPSAHASSATDAARHADLVVIAVPDSAVAQVAQDLAVADAVSEGSRWIHLAGSLGLDVLRPVHLAGAHIAALHPAQALSDPSTDYVGLDGCAWAVTATPADRSWARRLVRDIGGVPFDVADADRLVYHAAMALGGNAISTIIAVARDLLMGIHVEEPEAFLGPLSTAAAQMTARDGARALTGPVRRGDAATVARHLDELTVVMPDAAELYRTISHVALALSRRAGLDAELAEQVADVLHK